MTARRALALFAALCALAALVLGLLVSARAPGSLDLRATHATTDLSTRLLDALVLPTEPYVLVPAIALIAGVLWYLRRRRDALLAVAAPLVAAVLNTWVLKPAFGRWKGGSLAYPSGHTVTLVTVLVVVVLVVRPKVLAFVIGAVLLACATVGMIGLGYHYLTDIVGGACFAAAVVTGLQAALSPRPGPELSTG
ncbi:phosphatase PAP2 family protein [Amycolatopsis jejuensis]|uniref:phosphatase PAP2 family protein n=1 Tax=Amycolatopsis jejuensis TaxID=330084 RepID=UPI0005270C6D|nr:phosphatase PAP2 family protein [Amycolatopsis jejuensis]